MTSSREKKKRPCGRFFFVSALAEYHPGPILKNMARHQGSLTPPYAFSDFQGADGSFDFEAKSKAEKQWLEKVKADLRSKAKGDLIGEEVRFPRGDGYARYLIAKQSPFILVHLNVDDAWHADSATIRGFRLKDARDRVEGERRWAAQQEAHQRASEKFYEEYLGKTVHYHNGFGEYVRCEVVQAPEEVVVSRIKKGEPCLKKVALVGNWRSHNLRPDSYHVKGCREGDLVRPHLSNVYEFSKSLQKQEADPRGMSVCLVQD